MLWLIIEDKSYSIVGCNIAEREGQYELWVTRPGDKGLLVEKSEDKSVVEEVKQAIDYAVENREQTLNLN